MVPIEMQFDTGAAVSIIPMLTWKTIGSPRSVQTNKLRVYGGGRVEVMGKCTLMVEYGELKEHSMLLYLCRRTNHFLDFLGLQFSCCTFQLIS
ncbi:hypothetical protein GJ496_000917 [Pomphorhynchus laevis]|nr:hypothetical protein GJ496_000917 [Pomphorhynchus laevis]